MGSIPLSLRIVESTLNVESDMELKIDATYVFPVTIEMIVCPMV